MKKRKLFTILAFIIFVLCLGYVLSHLQWGFTNPFEKVRLNNITSLTKDKKGNFLVLDDSGRRILKISPEEEVLYQIEAKGFLNKKSFYSAKGIITDDENNLYILDYVGSLGGGWTDQEVIYQYNEHGKLVETCYGKQHDSPVATASISNLLQVQGQVCFAERDDSSLYIKNIKGELVKQIPYENALLLLQKVIFNNEDNTYYFVSKKGEIGRFLEDKSIEILFKPEGMKDMPYNLAFTEQNELLISNLATRTIDKLDNGVLSPYIWEYSYVEENQQVEENKDEGVILSILDTQNGLVASENYGVLECEEEIRYLEGGAYNIGLVATIVLLWISYGVIALGLLYGLFLLIKWIFLSKNKIIYISTGIVAGTILFTVVFSLITIQNINGRMQKEVLKREQVVANIAKRNIPINSFTAIKGGGDFLGEDYNQVKESIEKVLYDENGDLTDLYCVLYTFEEGEVISRFSLEEKNGAFFPYDWNGEDEKSILETQVCKVYSKLSTTEGNFIFVLQPIIDAQGNSVGLIEVGTDLDVFQRDNRSLLFDLILNIIVIAITLILITIEGISFYQYYSEYKANRVVVGNTKFPVEMYRLVVFLIFFIINMTTSFMSVYALKIAEGNSYGIQKEVLAAIPISAEVLFGALFSLFGSVLIKRFNTRKTAIGGAILFVIGLLIRFAIPNIWLLTLGSAIQGTGWGIILLIINSLIAGEEDPDARERGFVGYNTACMGGVNTGIVFGGFLLNWVSYRSVFLVAAILGGIVLLYTIFYIQNRIKGNQEELKEESKISFFKFIGAPKVWMYFIGIVIPIVAGGYFLNYLYPIIGSELGMKETHIGYSYLLNGLCVICLGSILTKKLSKKLNKVQILVLASLLYGISFFLVGQKQSVEILLVVLVLLGIAASFGFSVQGSYYADLKEVQSYGPDKAMGVYSLVENLAETSGSFLFSFVLIGGLNFGMKLMGILVFALAVIFGLVVGISNRYRRKQ